MKPTHIVIHHSLTQDGATVSWSAIRRYHTSYRYKGEIITEAKALQMIASGISGVEKPWRDIGYHYGIELVGDQYEIFVGRMLNDTGAHCIEGGMNNCAIGICLIGNFDTEYVPIAQLAKLTFLVQSLMVIFMISKDKVKRHADYAPYKSCPGSKFPWTQFLTTLK